MQFNPYQSPAHAAVEVSDKGSPRPLAVWLFQLILLVIVGLSIVGLVRLLASFTQHELRTPLVLGTLLVLRIALIAGLCATAVGIHRRRKFGRWLGIIAIVGYAIFQLILPDTTQYSNDAQRAGGLIARILIVPLLCAWWAYAFGFSTKAKRYFSQGSASMSKPR